MGSSNQEKVNTLNSQIAEKTAQNADLTSQLAAKTQEAVDLKMKLDEAIGTLADERIYDTSGLQEVSDQLGQVLADQGVLHEQVAAVNADIADTHTAIEQATPALAEAIAEVPADTAQPVEQPEAGA